MSALLTVGCSLAYDLSPYDEGTGSATGAGGGGGDGVGAGATSVGGAGGGGGASPACGGLLNPRVSSVKETFDSGYGSVAPFGPCVSEDAGTVLFSPSSPPLDYCWVSLPGVLDLRCDALTFRLLEATSPVLGAQTYVYLTDTASGDGAHLILEGGGFGLGREDGSASIELASSIYNPTADRYVRIRADEDTMYLETSADGAAFVVRGSGPYLIPLDSLDIRVGAGAYSAIMSNPGQARIDCLNVTPCP